MTMVESASLGLERITVNLNLFVCGYGKQRMAAT